MQSKLLYDDVHLTPLNGQSKLLCKNLVDEIDVKLYDTRNKMRTKEWFSMLDQQLHDFDYDDYDSVDSVDDENTDDETDKLSETTGEDGAQQGYDKYINGLFTHRDIDPYECTDYDIKSETLKSLPDAVWYKTYGDNSESRCIKCGNTVLRRVFNDKYKYAYIIPKNQGGRYCIDNLQTVCTDIDCNDI